jgi:hypothetical protein
VPADLTPDAIDVLTALLEIDSLSDDDGPPETLQ